MRNISKKFGFLKTTAGMVSLALAMSIAFSGETVAVEKDAMMEVLSAMGKGDRVRAENICTNEIERLKAAGIRDNKLAAMEVQQAGFLLDRKQGAEAELLLVDAAAIYEKIDGNPSLMYDSTMNMLALAYESQEKWVLAEPIVAKMVQKYHTQGADSRVYAMIAERYAKILSHIPGREEDAKKLQTQSKTIEINTAPSPELVKLQMEGLRAQLAKDYVKAERTYRQAVAKAIKLYGTNDVRYIDCASGLANALMSTNRYGEAEALFKQVLAFQQKTRSNQAGLTMSLLSTCLTKQGKTEQAQSMQDAALRQSISSMRKSDPKMAAKFQDLETSIQESRKQMAKIIGPLGSIENLSVKSNMRTVQFAAKMYSLDNRGFYPAGVDMGLVSYFSGGNTLKKLAGEAPDNPFSKRKEWPVLGKYIPAAKLAAMPPGQMVPGSIEYCVSADRRSFTVRGGGGNGKALPDGRGTLVLSEK